MRSEEKNRIVGPGLERGQAGLRLERRFTRHGEDPLDAVDYVERSSVIRDPDGSEVFRMDGIEVPADWSQLATDVLVSKYFRKAGVPETGSEKSARQVIRRISRSVRSAGETLGGYFASQTDADVFEAELAHLLVNQVAAFNSPVWFNVGLSEQYGISGSGGNWAWSFEDGEPLEIEDAYSRPLCSACFIQSLDDDLMSIFQLVKNEARLFKYGSGTGTNFSKLRSKDEMLSGGGTSSGLMSFLEVFDRGAGATKSGGTTRRAAKMVCLDADHPEIVDFIRWKVKEEEKARILIAAGYSADFNGEAYHTVAGQNSNNSVRFTDEFMEAALENGSWETRYRSTGELHRRWPAAELLDEVARAAWACADPGIQYETTINRWHTCPESGPIRASNPCSEYLFLDDSACNLASINLLKFADRDGRFHVDAFLHTARILFLAQEILIDFASYPTREIASNSHLYRPLGLGYAGVGALLMGWGIPYDSDRGRTLTAAVTALLTGAAYRTSAEIAGEIGPFERYGENRESFLEVMEKHRRAARDLSPSGCPEGLHEAAVRVWDDAVSLGRENGFRNAQATVIAPTGTIGLLMDCETTGIEPDFALVKFKKLAGGGHFKIVNQALSRALRGLGYSDRQAKDIIAYVSGTLSFADSPHINRESLVERDIPEEIIELAEKALPSVFHLDQAFSPRILGEGVFESLRIPPERVSRPDFSLLNELGFTDSEVADANTVVCGRLTVEGAPHLKEEHLPVFDCASRCGDSGTRMLSPMAHITMMAAVQPFISGAISKTVNLPHETTADEIREVYVQAWRLGLKALAVYRDGCKGSQPLTSGGAKTVPGSAAAGETAGTGSTSQVLDTALPRVLERHRLPKKRRGFTQEAKVGGHKVYLRTGEYDDGRVGEIFLDMHKEGAALRSMMNCFAIAISLGLQYGVPLKEFVDCFTFTKFEPQGIVEGHPNIKMSTSVIDYIFRVLAYEYMGMTEFLQIKPAADEAAESADPAEEPLDDPSAAVGPETAGHPPAQETGSGATAPGRTRGADDGAVLSRFLNNYLGDAPFCDQCGHITVRNGACYKCLNCGNSMGCS